MKKIFAVFLCVIGFQVYAQTRSNPTATSVTPTSFVLNWTAVFGASSNTIQIATDSVYTNIVTSFHPSPIASAGSRLIQGLTPGRVYYFKQFGTTTSRTGMTGEFNGAGLVSLPLPPLPTPMVGPPGSITSNSFVVNWTAFPVAVQGSIGKISIEVASDQAFSHPVQAGIPNIPVTATTALITVSDADQAYYYRLQAISNNVGFNGFSNSSFSAVTGVTLPPQAPTGLFTSPIDTSSVDLLWSPVKNVIEYGLDFSSDSTFSKNNIYTNLPVSGTRQTVTGLRPNAYFFRVRAISNASHDTSANSLIQRFVIAPPPPRMTPPSSVDSISFVANWKAVSGAQLYWLEVATDSTFTSHVDGYAGIPIDSTSCLVVRGLSGGKTYYYRTRASSNNGISDYSQPLSVKLAPSIVPGGGSSPEDPFKVNIIPPSPEAAALAKYADIPVSLYSGTPSITIPLYELKERGLSLPISLSYQATGHKVETIAPRTGLGWSLNAGGVVTRVVRGWPDEHPRGWLRSDRPFNTITEIASKSDDDKYIIYNPLAEGCLDAEPDLFYFNFAGYTGQFMYDADRTLKIVSGNSIKIEPIGLILNDPKNVHYIQGWTVTVDDGTIFTFQERETTQVSQQISLGDCSLVSETAQNQMPQSWFLTEMRSADQQSWIHFDYRRYSQFNTYWSLETEVRNPLSLSLISAHKEKLDVINSGVNLRKITVSSGQTIIDFLPDSTSARADVTTNPSAPGLNNNFALGQINVSNINGRQVEHWDFQYGYSTNRLTLTSINESAGGVVKPPYQFTYTGSLPAITSFARDHWGFNNNNSANTLIPDSSVPVIGQQPVHLIGADRSPSDAVLNGMLTKITYPTGGTDTFTFEPHDYSFEQTSELIDEVTVHEGFSIHSFERDDAGERFTSHSTNFTITAPSPSETTTVTIDYSFEMNYSGPSGNSYTPYASITDSNGKVLDGRGQAPQQANTDYTSTLKLKPGTYTVTASQQIPNVRDPNSPSGGNVLTVSVDWYRDTGARVTEIRKGGGVRIAKIVRSFGNRNPDKVTKYDYTIVEGGKKKSSGSLLESGYVYEYSADYASPSNGTIPSDIITQRFVRFSQNRSALGTTQGSHVGYSHVTVLQGEYGENGRTVYHYNSPREIPDFASFTVPFPPSISFDYQRGLLLEQVDFAAHSNDTLRVVKNTYQFFEHDVPALKVGWAVNGATVRGAQHLDIYALGGYVTQLGYGRLTETRERTINAGIPLETHATFTYGETTHKQLISSTITDSKGNTYVTSLKYPKDYITSNSAINLMKTLHIENVPIEKLTWRKGTGSQVSVLSGLKTDFTAGTNGGVVPQLKYGAKISFPVSTTDPFGAVRSLYEGRLSFKSFDGFNNPKQVALVDGMNTTYLWGYAGTLPIAKVDNAVNGQIFYESFEELTGASISTSQHRTGQRSLILNGTYAVPAASSPTVSGDYILSYWFTASESTTWTYHEKQISNYTPGNTIVTDAVSGLLDEVRVYPVGALMTTYTYEPLVGVTSVTDPGNTTVNYQYDGLGRLQYVKDLNGNVVEGYTYQFLQNVPFPSN